ncbi:MAG: hypothetical protein K0Q81_1068 [Paenibacillus sp.]|nr:hypothetical protein [Paenibacillus sp.]
MYLWKETNWLLNDQALHLNGTMASFKVHYWGITPRLFDNPVHKHSFFEVCYVLDGEGEYTDNGIDYTLSPGTHFCSKPGVTHQIRTEEGLCLLFVAFDLDEAGSQDSTIESFRSLAAHGEAWVPDGTHTATAFLWRTLLIQANGMGNLPVAAIQSVAYSLILSFLTLFGHNEQRSSVKQGPAILLQQAKHYIRDNLSRPLTLRDIAEYLSVSERHLSRLFSVGIHENFTNYIRDERIRLAAQLLGSSELSIKEIAEATGFSSVHYFTRLFMKVKKLPPGQFRKRLIMEQAFSNSNPRTDSSL